MLPFHIVTALISLAFTSYLFFFPSEAKLYVAEALVILTLVSGLYLVFSKPANMLQVCVTGLVYLAFVSVGLIATRKKLALHHG